MSGQPAQGTRGAPGTPGALGALGAPATAPPRGWYGPAGGQVGHVDPPALWRATTVQACGLWPFAAAPARR